MLSSYTLRTSKNAILQGRRDVSRSWNLQKKASDRFPYLPGSRSEASVKVRDAAVLSAEISLGSL